MSQHTSWVMGTRIRLFSEDAGPSKNAGPRHATQSFFLRCRAVRDPHVPTENKTPPAHVPTLLAVLLVPCMCQAPSSWAWRHSDSETVLIFEKNIYSEFLRPRPTGMKFLFTEKIYSEFLRHRPTEIQKPAMRLRTRVKRRVNFIA